MKTADADCLLRIESSSAGFQSLLCELLWRTCLDSIALHAAVSGIESGAEHVRKGLHDFSSFLQVKALCNFTLGSYPLLLHVETYSYRFNYKRVKEHQSLVVGFIRNRKGLA